MFCSPLFQKCLYFTVERNSDQLYSQTWVYSKITVSLTTAATTDRVIMYAITTKNRPFLYKNSKKHYNKNLYTSLDLLVTLVINNKTGIITNIKNIKVFKIFLCTVQDIISTINAIVIITLHHTTTETIQSVYHTHFSMLNILVKLKHCVHYLHIIILFLPMKKTEFWHWF